MTTRTISLIGPIAAGVSGIPRYATRLITAIDEVAPEFSHLEVTVVAHRPVTQALELRNLQVVEPLLIGRASVTRGAKRLAIEQIAALRKDSDLIHFFDLSLPLLAPRQKFTATVHDAAPMHHFTNERHLHKRLLQPWATRRAAKLVAVSQFAKDEAVNLLGANPARVSVVHSGPGLSPASVAPRSTSDSSRPGSTRMSLLYVGNFAVHKNLEFLVSNFVAADIDAELLLVGSQGSEGVALASLVERLGATDRVRILTGVSDERLENLYSEAAAVVLPSTYEGFGFTALEAMSRSKPVIASDIPAIREVCSNAADLVPPQDGAAWRSALRRAASNPGFRADLVRRGHAAVRHYSWNRTARGVCEVLLEAAGDPG